MHRGQTINSGLYIKNLKLCRTFSGEFDLPKNNPEILPQHNQVRSHKSFENQEAIKILGWTVLPHKPYSADLASSDFDFFGALKGAIRGKRFGSFDRVMEEVKKWLRLQNSGRYRKRIDALVSSLRKAVKVYGDNVQK
jgi:hypothetical protein